MTGAKPFDLRPLIENLSANQSIKAFLEEALCLSLIRDKALLLRANARGTTIIVDKAAVSIGDYAEVTAVTGKPYGTVIGLFTETTPEFPTAEQVAWAECVRVTLEQKGGETWLVLDPDVWIWPPRARKSAVDFLSQRRLSRKNDKYNQLLTGWVKTLLATNQQNTVAKFTPFSSGDIDENPEFKISSRTAYARGSD